MKTFTKALMVLSLSFGLAACDPDGGSSSSDWIGHPVDPAMPTGTAQFVGVWKYESLDGWITCSDGQGAPFTMVSGTETFTRGERPDQVIGIDLKGCRSDCQVSGNTANCQTGGSACGDGVTIVEDVYTYAAGSLSERSTAQFVADDGLDCVATGTAVLTPVE